MYGIDTLKENIEISIDTIECPIKNCKNIVKRKRDNDDLTICEITCPIHNIEIRSTTFIYPKKEDNLLWTDSKDIELLNKIDGHKRESRMENDNSEDAVTWNVFRYLDKEQHLSDFVEIVTGKTDENVEDIIYWSYSKTQKNKWDLLAKAQNIFGEKKGRGSEPDMAIETDQSVIFIEAKFNSGNTTEPSNPKVSLPNYSNGGDYWSRKVFSEPLEIISLERKRYELMRFWLLGSWMANESKKDFYLINLVRKANSEKLEKTFKPAIKESIDSPVRMVKRVTWEEIYHMLEERNINDETLKAYFQNKISGYSSNGEIKQAFNLKS